VLVVIGSIELSNLLTSTLFYTSSDFVEIPFVAPHLAPGIKKVPEYQRLKLKLAVRTGLEPATPCVTGMYSNQLNYRTVCYLVAQN
jgi:hypothetical protein